MKPRHVQAVRTDARATLASLNIPLGAEFYALDRDRVEALLTEARRVKYRLPANANGSKARYFHELLQRRAR